MRCIDLRAPRDSYTARDPKYRRVLHRLLPVHATCIPPYTRGYSKENLKIHTAVPSPPLSSPPLLPLPLPPSPPFLYHPSLRSRAPYFLYTPHAYGGLTQGHFVYTSQSHLTQNGQGTGFGPIRAGNGTH